MKIDWKDQLIREESQEIEICTGPLKANLYRFRNGAEREIKTAALEQLVVVLSGECDVKLNGGRYRLNTGSWINFPAGAAYRVHVFRSCEDCYVLCVSAWGCPSGVVSCNMLDMPAMDGTVHFGLECGGMTGTLNAEEQESTGDELEVQIMHGAAPRQILITAGKKGNDYLRWLKEECGILWEQGVMEL